MSKKIELYEVVEADMISDLNREVNRLITDFGMQPEGDLIVIKYDTPNSKDGNKFFENYIQKMVAYEK